MPVMALEGLDFADAWHRLLAIIRREQGKFAVYLLLKLVLAIAAGILFTIIAVVPVIFVVIPGVAAVVAARAAGYPQEMERIESEIESLGASTFDTPVDTERVTKYVSYLYQRASLAGDLNALGKVESAIDCAIALRRESPIRSRISPATAATSMPGVIRFIRRMIMSRFCRSARTAPARGCGSLSAVRNRL